MWKDCVWMCVHKFKATMKYLRYLGIISGVSGYKWLFDLLTKY